MHAESDTAAAEEAKKYATFWKEFGKAIKLGLIEDVQNRQRLAKLVRFETSKSDGKDIGLDAYIANMKEGQKSIYYLAGKCMKLIGGAQQLTRCCCVLVTSCVQDGSICCTDCPISVLDGSSWQHLCYRGWLCRTCLL